MTALLLPLAALAAFAVLALLSPEGWEDESGFHHGPEIPGRPLKSHR
jgi:hypothetical protein